MSKRNFLSGIVQGFLVGAYRSFLRKAGNMPAISERVLINILKRNRNTEYGLRYKFSSIKTADQFRACVPLSTYNDYEESVERMVAGEKNILTAEALHSFGLTSGTTGKSKTIPVSRRAIRNLRQSVQLVNLYTLARFFPGIFRNGKGAMLNSSAGTGRTAQGVPVGPISAILNGSRNRKKARLQTTPLEVSELQDYGQALYLHVLFAIKERHLKYMGGGFASSILDFFLCLEKNWEQLLKDLESGTIRGVDGLEPVLHKQLEQKLGRSPARAQEIGRILSAGMEDVAIRLWPEFSCVFAIRTGPFKAYNHYLQFYLGDIPVFSAMYCATEGFFGVNLDPTGVWYIMIPGNLFFEFIPFEHCHEENPPVYPIDHLEPGKDYELVITGDAGLYRYRMGDIIRVVKYFKATPVIEFLHRTGTLLNIAAEKTSEDAVIQALSKVRGEKKIEIIDFTTSPVLDGNPGYYQFYIEFKQPLPGEYVRGDIAEALERALAETNPRYGFARQKRKLASLRVLPLKKDSFAKYKEEKIRRGVSANQVKVPHIIEDKDLLAYFVNHVAVPPA